MAYNGWKMTFVLVEVGCQFWQEAGGRYAMKADLQEGILCFSMLFDSHDIPLCLKAPAEVGDRVTVCYRPYRLELFVNGQLADEEWPYGRPLAGDRPALTEVRASVSLLGLPPADDGVKLPVVSGTFVNAENWRPEKTVFVGDCMPYSFKGRYHVLFLSDRRHHGSKWGNGAHQWAHISSEDLVNWQIHPMAVVIDDPEEGSICTGSWIEYEEKQYLFYSIRTCDGSPAPIRRSISEDGYHFTKDRTFSLILSERYEGVSVRDPKLIQDEAGIFHMFVTTSIAGESRGCLAHLYSENLKDWKETETPVYRSPNEAQPECADYIHYQGYYYLIFSLHGRGQYRYSDHPFSGWKKPERPEIPCGTVPKGAVWKNRLLFAGFQRKDGYAGNMTFLEAFVQDNGELAYKPVREMIGLPHRNYPRSQL